MREAPTKDLLAWFGGHPLRQFVRRAAEAAFTTEPGSPRLTAGEPASMLVPI